MHEAQPPEPPPLPTERRSPKRSWQFSMRTMLIGMTGFAVLLGLQIALDFQLFRLLIQIAWLTVTGWLLTGAVFAQADHKAFCIGAAVVFCTHWIGGDNRFWFVMSDTVTDVTDSLGLPRGPFVEVIYLAFVFCISFANGYVCVHARRYFESHATE